MGCRECFGQLSATCDLSIIMFYVPLTVNQDRALQYKINKLLLSEKIVGYWGNVPASLANARSLAWMTSSDNPFD